MAELAFLKKLESVIESRIAAGDENSYTARLAQAGPLAAAKKLGEEGVETALAGATEDASRLKSEAADLLYHLLVLLAIRSIKLDEVVAELEQRHRA